jgi:hypothetical protein
MVNPGDAAPARRPHLLSITGTTGGRHEMTNRLAKIIQFGAKRRHIRGRVTSNGEVIRTLIPLRQRRDDDDGPRAASLLAPISAPVAAIVTHVLGGGAAISGL